MYSTLNAVDTYKRVFRVCDTPGFFLEIGKKIYKKDELTYDFVASHASQISYIESTDISNSRIYPSTFIMMLIVLMMDRHEQGPGIKFIGMSEDLVKLLHHSCQWTANSGYNSAINDVKILIGKLNQESEHIGGMT